MDIQRRKMMFGKKRQEIDPIYTRIKTGMTADDVMRVLESENLHNIGSKDFLPGQTYAFKIFARRGRWFSWSWASRDHNQFLFYFDQRAKLVKIGNIPLIEY